MNASHRCRLALTGLLWLLAGCTPFSVTTTTPIAPPPSSRAGVLTTQSRPGALSLAPDTSASRAAAGENSSLLLGNPSRAAEGIRADPDNRLVVRPQHSLSYNRSQGGPNWVAWHLERSDLGSVRRGQFRPDPILPPDSQIRPTDYRGSGFDRGHVCPSGDRTNSRQNNDATFVMSNMLPQTAALNQHVWAKLEEYERAQVRAGNELYIVAGGAGSQGHIAAGRINVPAVCWKILVVLPRGDNDLGRMDANTRVIAVAMPNRERGAIEGSRWAQWITNVGQIEKTTGYTFFSALPLATRQALKIKVDSGRASSTGSADRSNARTSSGVSSERRISEERPMAPPDALAAPPVSNDSPRQAPSQESYRPPASEERPAAGSQPAPGDSPATAGAVQVWVNTNSGIYHFPGTRWYGTTKEGAYMSESAAIGQGYRAARNGQ